jgi:hypothetical protein
MIFDFLGKNPFEKAITGPETQLRFFHAETNGIALLTGLGATVFLLILAVYEILRRMPAYEYVFFPNQDTFE